MENKKYRQNDDSKKIPEYICPSASWGDMTGLIPGGITDPEKYQEIYPFLPEYGGNNQKKK